MKSKRRSEVVLVTAMDSHQEDYMLAIKRAFNALGYKVILLKDSSEMVMSMRDLEGVWCISGSMQGNATSQCSQRHYLDRQEAQKVGHHEGNIHV